uniref:SWIM zinc finger family protein n=1 Tax=Burkholderia sp. Ac-20379 TaxID=2703900 RepID=UPI00198102D6
MSAPVRGDLLDLTPEALTALANAGFVKRAQKDLAAGIRPRLEMDAGGALHAAFDDGTRTSLPPDRTLRDAQCNCAASGMCRHRVMLVLAYQAQQREQGAEAADTDGAASSAAAAAAADAEPEAWSPARFDDAMLAASFAPTVLDQAARLAATRPAIAVQPWAGASVPPAARLPMCSVRFFSRGSLAHARCDCKLGGGCVHVVLAVWAFRAAGELPPGGPEKVVELRAPSTGAEADDA